MNIWSYFEWAQRSALRQQIYHGGYYIDHLAIYIREIPYDPYRFPNRVVYGTADKLAIEAFFLDYEEYKKRNKSVA